MKIWQPSVTSGLYFCLKERKTPDKTLENRAICKNVCPLGNVYVVKLPERVLNLERSQGVLDESTPKLEKRIYMKRRKIL